MKIEMHRKVINCRKYSVNKFRIHSKNIILKTFIIETFQELFISGWSDVLKG